MPAASKVNFFDVTDNFGFASSLNGWKPTGGGSPQRSTATTPILGQDGDEIKCAEYDKKEAVTCSYVLDKLDGNIILPKPGSMLTGYHVDTITLAFSQTEFPTLEITGHKHLDGKPDADCRTYTPSVVIPCRGIGVPSSIPGVFTLSPLLNCGMRTLTYSMSVNHTDVLNCEGQHLVGNNNDGAETIEMELTGDIIPDDLDIQEGWRTNSNNVTQSNTDVTTSSYSLEHHVAHDEPAKAASEGI